MTQTFGVVQFFDLSDNPVVLTVEQFNVLSKVFENELPMPLRMRGKGSLVKTEDKGFYRFTSYGEDTFTDNFEIHTVQLHSLDGVLEDFGFSRVSFSFIDIDEDHDWYALSFVDLRADSDYLTYGNEDEDSGDWSDVFELHKDFLEESCDLKNEVVLWALDKITAFLKEGVAASQIDYYEILRFLNEERDF